MLMLCMGLLTGCSKEGNITPATQQERITDPAKQQRLLEAARQLPAIGVYNRRMDKVIVFRQGNDGSRSFNFVDPPTNGINFASSNGGQWTWSESEGLMVLTEPGTGRQETGNVAINAYDREQYLAKRRELLRSPTHLVEIDLLRGWAPMPREGGPECDYSVMVSRAETRRAADFRPIQLRDRLPVIPVPLRPANSEAQVDLQEVLHRAYDGPGYEHFIYGGRPEPRLSTDDTDDAAWARQFVPAEV